MLRRVNARRLLLALPVLAIAIPGLSALIAQEPPSTPSSKAIVIKGVAPVATDVLKVKLPRPVEGDLPNGLHLMVLEDHRVPLITFQLQIPGAGGYFDPADRIGLASFTASLLREGTTTRQAPQIGHLFGRFDEA